MALEVGSIRRVLGLESPVDPVHHHVVALTDDRHAVGTFEHQHRVGIFRDRVHGHVQVAAARKKHGRPDQHGGNKRGMGNERESRPLGVAAPQAQNDARRGQGQQRSSQCPARPRAQSR